MLQRRQSLEKGLHGCQTHAPNPTWLLIFYVPFSSTTLGWADPDLSVDGVREVEHAARLLLEGGWDIDLVFTSRLKRAIRSAWIILQELNEVYLPVFKSWRLNERCVPYIRAHCFDCGNYIL